MAKICATLSTFAHGPEHRPHLDGDHEAKRRLLSRSGSSSSSGVGAPIARRAQRLGLPKEQPLRPHDGHELLHLAAARDANWLRVCKNKQQPYYFFSKWGAYARPLSGRLQTTYYDKTASNRMNDLKQLLLDHGDYRLSYLDPTFNRVYRLERGTLYRNDPSLSAALFCLVQAGPLSISPSTDAELVSTTIAAACHQMGFLVRRNAQIAENLKTRIPTQDTHRAFHLACEYCDQNGLTQVRDYLHEPADFFDDRDLTQPAPVQSYLDIYQWPRLAMSLFDWVFSDRPHDP